LELGLVSAIDLRGEQSGLLTPIAMMESGTLFHVDEKLTAFLELGVADSH
jgi:hypothetical protein